MDIKSHAAKLDVEAESFEAQDTGQSASTGMESDSERTAPNRIADEILGQPIPESRNLSVIGQTLTFKGDLVAEEDLLIQGRVNGTISHRAKNLTIGAHGDVRANIVAQNVIVQGKIHGEIRASESVIVEPSASVVGDIFAPRVGLKEGAKFKGSIDMDTDAEPAKKTSSSSVANKKSADRPASGKKPKEAELTDADVNEVLN